MSRKELVISRLFGVDFLPEKIHFLLDVIFYTKGIKLIDQKVEANLNQEVSALKYRQQKKVSAKTATFRKRRLFGWYDLDYNQIIKNRVFNLLLLPN